MPSFKIIFIHYAFLRLAIKSYYNKTCILLSVWQWECCVNTDDLILLSPPFPQWVCWKKKKNLERKPYCKVKSFIQSRLRWLFSTVLGC